MKPSQNLLFKADTYIKSAAESGILGLVHGLYDSLSPSGETKKGSHPSEVKGLRFAPIPSGLAPLTSFTRLLRGVHLVSSGKQGLFIVGKP